MSPLGLARDQDGQVLVEATILMTFMFVLVTGSVDFLFAFYELNAAAKAVEFGARIAAVSNPVASGLNGLSQAAVTGSVSLGAQMPAFTVTCDGSAGSCTCTSGACSGVSYDVNAMRTIVFGRPESGGAVKTACATPSSSYYAGMCNMFDGIAPANVKILYTQPQRAAALPGPGLGYAGRPCGPVPTITVQLQNLQFQYFFLAGLMSFTGFNNSPLVTMTGEDLYSQLPNPYCVPP